MTDKDEVENKNEDIDTEGVSAALTDAIEIEPDLEPLGLFENSIVEADKKLSQFTKLRAQFENNLKESMITSLFPAANERENYYKRVAYMLYREIHKQARLFLKDWCIVNNYKQKWSNPFVEEFRRNKLSAHLKFAPKIFNLALVDKSVDNGKEILVAEMQLTARDAAIEGAKKIGFDNSMYRAKGLARFNDEAVKVILSDIRYLREVRMEDAYEEHRRQIDSMRFIPQDVKDRWFLELTEKFKNSIVSKII